MLEDRLTDRQTDSAHKVEIQSYIITQFTNISNTSLNDTICPVYTNVIAVVQSPHLRIPKSNICYVPHAYLIF